MCIHCPYITCTRAPNTLTGFSRYGYLYASTFVTLAQLAYGTTNFHLILSTIKLGLKKIQRSAITNDFYHTSNDLAIEIYERE